ncbi:MAG: hypothetical protein M3Q98_04100 [Actinomycetota bacterium]|nr:hypothetical protein [Actinomycetota bacterium]
MPKTISAAFASSLILALGACGVDDKTVPAPTPTQETSSSNAFCKDFTAKGGDATTLGPFQAFEAKEDLAREIDDKLAAMNGVEPPTELADAWKRYRSYYGSVKAAVDKLPQHGHLSDPELLAKGNALATQSKQFTDYWFANCG